jgi:hypothetical protein
MCQFYISLKQNRLLSTKVFLDESSFIKSLKNSIRNNLIEKPSDLEITGLLNQLVLIFKRKSKRNLVRFVCSNLHLTINQDVSKIFIIQLEKLLQNHEKTYSILKKVFDLRYDIISCSNFLLIHS